MDPVQIAILLNVIADLYIKLKDQWPEVKPEDLAEYIKKKEEQADVNDYVLGVK